MTFVNSHVWSLRFINASTLAYAPRRGGATGGAARAGRASSGAFGARRSARGRAVGGERQVETIRDWIVHELAVSILRPRHTVARMIIFRAMRRRDRNLYQAHEARLGNLYSALLVRPLRRRTLEAFVIRTDQHLSSIMVFTRWLEHHSLCKSPPRPCIGQTIFRWKTLTVDVAIYYRVRGINLTGLG